MGKQRQKRKTSKRRINPLQRKGIEAGINEANAKLPVPTAEQVAPVVERLSSNDATERAWAAACVSNLILSNAATRKLLLTRGVVPTLITMLADPQQEVKDESLGALRNLASVDNTVAKEYYSRKILEPLSNLLPQISQTIDNVLKKTPVLDEADQDRRKSIWDVTENYIYIIWCICEASDKYVKAINRMNVVAFLTSFLVSGHECPTRVVIAAGQCLNTLTDDNKDICIEFQNHPEYIQSLLNIVNNNENADHVLVQVLACAILINIREVVKLNDSWDEDVDNIEELHQLLVPVLVRALDYDIQEAANGTVAAVQSGKLTNHQNESSEITPKPKQPLTSEDIYIQNVENRLSIIQLALELLADICTQDEEEDGVLDNPGEDDVMGEEEREEFGGEEEIDPSIFSHNKADETLFQTNPVLNAYVHQIFPQLIRLSTATVISYVEMSLHSSVTQCLVLTHQRALECLNNFLLAMNELPHKIWFKQYKSDAIQLWRWLFSVADQVANSQPEEWARDAILEVVISCLWALGRGLLKDIPLEKTDVGALCGTFELIPITSIRVKIVGSLGPIAMRPSDINTNKTIGLFIMNILSNAKQYDAAIIVEALNLLYDVYSDCAFDYDYPVFVQGGFLNILKQIVPAVRSMVKAIDRRRDFDLRMRADEALDNLNAFIKYKKSEVNKKK